MMGNGTNPHAKSTTQWERDDASFIAVAEVVRWAKPSMERCWRTARIQRAFRDIIWRV